MLAEERFEQSLTKERNLAMELVRVTEAAALSAGRWMGKGNKELWEKFIGYYSAVFAEGALSEREKALIALGVAHAVQCPYCIDAYTQTCLEKGSNMEEMTEAVHVACAIRGGSSLVHGVQMRNVVDKLSM